MLVTLIGRAISGVRVPREHREFVRCYRGNAPIR